jgi:hypothetical protein
MSPFYTGLLVGIWIGVFLGILIIGLMQASRENWDEG